ncbi:serine protease, S1-C subfamily, contains C-terminal PDZ domain [Salipaludibacillus aurantiacus]|uniref:Serine protease, S1-C subfamily, contains C-terminal PDZ domain n=2 Tax=Salipaludibacillus aurantiacus TaxID=1601833 RepID=A0A1H9U7H5_9BACI|nr:serine protease, S1-C subfamily, contains C-terminal PDZ domain [Salipaludibacillus aurantiacus]
MFCYKCGIQLMRSDPACPNCRSKQPPSRKKFLTAVILALVIGLIAGIQGGVMYQSAVASPPLTTAPGAERSDTVKELKTFAVPAFIEERDAPRDLTEVIAEAQECVYTIEAPGEQGSAFLYNEQGIVITNAHVMRNSATATVITNEGEEYTATLEGSSEHMDVAVLHVEELEGEEPFPLEKEKEFKTGEEVVALGSPKGVRNTATMGHITGTNRDLTIGTYRYEDLYEISAHISEGNSGGPLLSKNEEKFIAINAAKSLDDPTIGFSIPFYKISSLIDELMNS